MPASPSTIIRKSHQGAVIDDLLSPLTFCWNMLISNITELVKYFD